MRRIGDRTPEEREHIRQARQEQIAEMQRMDEEILRLSGNSLCPVCHKGFMVSVVCRRYGGSIHEKHCLDCKYHEPKFWHCLYRARGGQK